MGMTRPAARTRYRRTIFSRPCRCRGAISFYNAYPRRRPPPLVSEGRRRLFRYCRCFLSPTTPRPNFIDTPPELYPYVPSTTGYDNKSLFVNSMPSARDKIVFYVLKVGHGSRCVSVETWMYRWNLVSTSLTVCGTCFVIGYLSNIVRFKRGVVAVERWRRWRHCAPHAVTSQLLPVGRCGLARRTAVPRTNTPTCTFVSL